MSVLTSAIEVYAGVAGPIFIGAIAGIVAAILDRRRFRVRRSVIWDKIARILLEYVGNVTLPPPTSPRDRTGAHVG